MANMDQKILLMTWMLALTHMVMAANSIDTPPKNVTASAGNDVTFECGATLDDPAKEMLRWMKATTVGDMTGGKMVWCALPNKEQCPDITDTDKYEIVGTYNLVIKNVQTADAGIYWCELVMAQTKKQGILIVVDGPYVEMIREMEEYEESSLGCKVRYGAPPKLGRVVDLNEPRLSAFIGTTDITSRMTTTEHEGKFGETPWIITGEFVFNATAEYDNKEFVCQVSTETPRFTAIRKKLIRVSYAGKPEPTSAPSVGWKMVSGICVPLVVIIAVAVSA